MRANPRNKLHCADQVRMVNRPFSAIENDAGSFPLPYSEPHHAGSRAARENHFSFDRAPVVVFFADPASRRLRVSAVTEPVRLYRPRWDLNTLKSASNSFSGFTNQSSPFGASHSGSV